MCAGTEYWKKALRISCALHLFAISAVGAIASNWEEAEPQQERYIAIELNAVEEQAGARGSLAQNAGQPLPSSGRSALAAAVPEVGQAPVNRTASSAQRVSTGSMMAPGGSDGSVEAQGGAGESGGGETIGGGGIAGGNGTGLNGISGQNGSSAADRSAAIDRFVSRVEVHKEYPYMALKRNQEGRPVVRVELDAEGNLISAALSGPSGISSLDNAAVKAVRSACPFQHGLGEALSIEVPVRYQLTGG